MCFAHSPQASLPNSEQIPTIQKTKADNSLRSRKKWMNDFLEIHDRIVGDDIPFQFEQDFVQLLPHTFYLKITFSPTLFPTLFKEGHHPDFSKPWFK